MTTIIVAIERSQTWRQQRALDTGEDIPRCIDVPIEAAALPMDVRGRLCSEGQWVKRSRAPVAYAHNHGEISTNATPWPYDADAITPEEFTALVRERWGAVEAEAAQYRADHEAATRRQQAAVEAAESAYREALAAALAAGPPYDVALPDIPGGGGELSYSNKSGILNRVHADIQTQLDARMAWIEAREAEAEAAKIAALAAIVDRLGTETQRERWAAGAMPRREVIDLATAEAAAPLSAASLTVLRTDDWHVDCDCDSEYRSCKQRDITCLSDAQWSSVKLIRSAVPDSASIVYHRDDCATCETRGAVYATVTWTTPDGIDISIDCPVRGRGAASRPR